MHKILTAIAVVAIGALGTSIIATVLLHSSISTQSQRIGALQHVENVDLQKINADHQKIVALQNEVGAAHKHKKPTTVQIPLTRSAVRALVSRG